MPELFTSANPMRFHFLSHKSARLVLPWAILLTWLATLLLPPSPLQRFLAVDPLFFVALAAADLFMPRRVFLKRITSPARSFLVMNLAALLSPLVFIVPARILWRPTEVTDAPALSTSTRLS